MMSCLVVALDVGGRVLKCRRYLIKCALQLGSHWTGACFKVVCVSLCAVRRMPSVREFIFALVIDM